MVPVGGMSSEPNDFDDDDASGLDEHSTILHAKFDPTPAPRAFTLSVVEGDDQGLRLTLDGSQPSRVLIGTSPACEVRLSDRTVSRRHVALDVVGSRVRISDLGSKNGTSVDGLSVVDAFLKGGELVRIGSTAFRLELEPTTPELELPAVSRFGRVIGASTEMRRLYRLCQKLAVSDVPVIVEGETGTGKEMLAEALHDMGPRKNGPFVVFDCTAVPVNLLEAELFGHERGAFTGAVASRRGVLEQANKGTLLIDEIGDLDITLQPKLLRAIERSEFRPIGSERVVKVDVRIIAATRRDLDKEVQAGRFRDDLFHRLAVARVELPPLNRRRGDIPLLVRHFCEELGGDANLISRELLAALGRAALAGKRARAPKYRGPAPCARRARQPSARSAARPGPGDSGSFRVGGQRPGSGDRGGARMAARRGASKGGRRIREALHRADAGAPRRQRDARRRDRRCGPPLFPGAESPRGEVSFRSSLW